MKKSNIHVLIACGGTGGHLFPGIAVGEVLAKRGHDVTLLISEKKIDTLAACIQPLIVFIMAGMVGFMAYIMMSTIFETISSIK